MKNEEKAPTYLKFHENKSVDGKLTYKKDCVYEIPEGSVDRWIKRGASVVDKDGTSIEEVEIEPVADLSDKKDEKKDSKKDDKGGSKPMSNLRPGQPGRPGSKPGDDL